MASGPEAPLQQVLSRYQAILRNLLPKQIVTGVSFDMLARFQKTHRDFAYTCRLGGCRRQVAGFETESLREQHEETHRSFFRCDAFGCQYPSFPSKSSLKRHVRDVHTGKRQYRRPIRRMVDMERSASSRFEGQWLPQALLHQYPALARMDWSGNDASSGMEERFQYDPHLIGAKPRVSKRRVDGISTRKHIGSISSVMIRAAHTPFSPPKTHSFSI